MKLAFSTLGCPDWRFNEILAMAKDFGFDGVEIRGVRSKLYAPEIAAFSDEMWPENKAKMERTNMEIPMLTSGICVKVKYDTLVEEALAYANLADKIGANYIRILADSQVNPTDPVSDEKVVENLKAIAEAAKDTKVVFLVETNGAYADSARLAKVLEKVGSEKVQALWDVHHPYRFFGETAEKTWENLGKYVKYVHLKDSVATEGVIKYKMMGKGDMPIDSFLQVLKDNGYDGYLSLEWVKRWNHELQEPGIVFVQYISFMRKKLR